MFDNTITPITSTLDGFINEAKLFAEELRKILSNDLVRISNNTLVKMLPGAGPLSHFEYLVNKEGTKAVAIEIFSTASFNLYAYVLPGDYKGGDISGQPERDDLVFLFPPELLIVIPHFIPDITITHIKHIQEYLKIPIK